ncbi:MAG: nitrogenase-stabilizing/protective protein NifW [Synechococcaceae cyanobacterium SM2_3_1]|nr:nitrogenase-stabilizing/protective protein NifW [Synechococcaceae cyanobacterium SM2_3_1]
MTTISTPPSQWQTFQALVNAEDYFTFLDLPYDPQVVSVNRLHILRQFSRNLESFPTPGPELTEAAWIKLARQALLQAYQTFLQSTPQEQKLFKVFHQPTPGVVLLSEITSD